MTRSICCVSDGRDADERKARRAMSRARCSKGKRRRYAWRAARWKESELCT